MAAIVRRTFPALRDELLARMGKTDASSNLIARAEYALWNAYQSLCLTVHHYELHTLDVGGTLSTSVNTDTLPTDLYAIMGIRLRDPTTSLIVGFLTEAHQRTVFDGFSDSTDHPKGLPTTYSRRDRDITLDRIADVAYKVDLLYYRRPASPDFAVTPSSELEEVWDQYIIEYACALLYPATWRFDMAAVPGQTLQEWFSRMTHPMLGSSQIVDVPQRPLAGSRMGGDQ